MTSNHLAQISQRMATATLALIISMLLLNTAVWLYPNLGTTYGLGFGLTERLLVDRLLAATGEQTVSLPWWQTLGGILLSSVPLLALACGLNHLRRLFQSYARGEYFSSDAASRLGKVGWAVAIWVVLDFLCEPMLSAWVTMNAPVGERLITLSVTAPSFVALFLAACISVIARILHEASDLDSESRSFV
ncbi:DUF2975 domain-containing protein [Pseudomonas sp. MWU15-20650]|uniref:DUF2975 domain-containing protein n=1 Tax=Pseudomonas sp. MWU15-20650 TaxID=2933107 RepID=UPI00200F55C5|nr:DUF2975 domain-containing protein [Pseudomonas sp. MWU15-20650]